MYLFFDTETTGLPKSRHIPATVVENWPRVVQLGYALFGGQGECIKKRSVIIKPDGFTIPEDSAKVHGITTEFALQEGVHIHDVLTELKRDVFNAQFLVAHNVAFDHPTIHAEFLRKQINAHWWEELPKICTMADRRIITLCKIPAKWGDYKWPSLGELHKKLFGTVPHKTHDACADVETCAKCFFELRRRGMVFRGL